MSWVMAPKELFLGQLVVEAVAWGKSHLIAASQHLLLGQTLAGLEIPGDIPLATCVRIQRPSFGCWALATMKT